MERYRVQLSEGAEQDLLEISDHIAIKLQSPFNAKKQIQRLMVEILSLDTLPERYSVIDTEPWQTRGLRHMPVDNYTVFYIVRDKQVIVTDVLYSASDLLARLRSDKD